MGQGWISSRKNTVSHNAFGSLSDQQQDSWDLGKAASNFQRYLLVFTYSTRFIDSLLGAGIGPCAGGSRGIRQSLSLRSAKQLAQTTLLESAY